MKNKKLLLILLCIVVAGLVICQTIYYSTDPIFSSRELKEFETMHLSRERIMEQLGSNYFDEDGIISGWNNVHEIVPGTDFYVRVVLKSPDTVYTDFEVGSIFYRLKSTVDKKGSKEYGMIIQNDQLYIRFELSDSVHSKAEGKKIFKEQVESYLQQITE